MTFDLMYPAAEAGFIHGRIIKAEKPQLCQKCGNITVWFHYMAAGVAIPVCSPECNEKE